MRTPLRIAILETDTPVDQVVERYGKYGPIFTTLLESGAEALNDPGIKITKNDLQISAFDVVTAQEYPELEDIDAILITGSKHNCYDNDPWILKLVEFVTKVLDQKRVRIIGVCYGHQIVGRAMGMQTGRSDGGWEIAVCQVQMTKKGQELFKKDTINVHQMHRDAIYEYPKGVEPLGSSPRCSVQGMYTKGRLITIQAHPEFNGEIMKAILLKRHQAGIFDDKIYKEAMARAESQHDGNAVAQAFLRFMLED